MRLHFGQRSTGVGTVRDLAVLMRMWPGRVGWLPLAGGYDGHQRRRTLSARPRCWRQSRASYRLTKRRASEAGGSGALRTLGLGYDTDRDRRSGARHRAVRVAIFEHPFQRVGPTGFSFPEGGISSDSPISRAPSPAPALAVWWGPGGLRTID